MKRAILLLLAMVLLSAASACTLSLLRSPSALPTPITISSPTPILVSPTLSIPSTTPILEFPSPTPGQVASATPMPVFPSATATSNTIPGAPSGPYAVILTAPADVLNIRSAAGVSNAVVGSFSSTATNVTRTGPSTYAGGDLWVEVYNPSGRVGWVNSYFLTEYVPPATFCSDSRVNNLLTLLDNAFTNKTGQQLSALVSPVHGMTVHLWRYGNPVTFKQNDARWVFESTFEHHWGEAPGSGLDTIGAFHVEVLPRLMDVFNANTSLTCDSLGTAPQYGLTPWPEIYANINYYTVFKPGTPGVDLDWRYWLVGVEYVQGQPTVFALIHFQWEP